MSDGVVLVGLPGSGKSTIGHRLAAALGRPFVDTDAIVSAHVNGDVARVLRELGEPAFREAESRAVEQALRQRGAVIATGGGALDDPLNRWRLWHHGPPMWLDASDAVLLRRLNGDRVERPLLAGDSAASLARLREQREPFYRAAKVKINTAPPPGTVCDELMLELGRLQGRVAGPMRLFDGQLRRNHAIGPALARVVFGCRLLPELLGDVLDDLGGTPRFVLDGRVGGVLGRQEYALLLNGGEGTKRFGQLEKVLTWLAEGRMERGDPLVAIGGGTVGDVAGLAAAVYARGVRWVGVPTTWLAQADAALGGKVAINLAGSKNAVGAFWPPSAVLADVATLRTLPPRHARNGLAEAVKVALIGDPSLWRLIEERGLAALRGDEELRYAIIERAARVKLEIVARDPFEIGERRHLNLGHTLGHAIESASRYRIGHGPAVALGLCAAADLATRRGADPELAARLRVALRRIGLPTLVQADAGAIRGALDADKKRTAGRQRWILPMAIGSVVEVDDVTESELTAALHGVGIGA